VWACQVSRYVGLPHFGLPVRRRRGFFATAR
jgi:hypothetical protein